MSGRLTDHLIARIDGDGPMSVADYMATCLTHPTLGYYTTRDPLGVAGDFTTAPEISQMFGELVGLSLAQSWLEQGAPGRFTLAELGPGRGTLMADILRATRGLPGFHDAAQVILVEVSEALRQEQAARLSDYGVQWIDSTAALPEGPLWLVANEFFDALPVRQFTHDAGHWRERQVGLREGHLTFGLGGPVALPALARFEAEDGQTVEIRPAAESVMTEIEDRIAGHGGAALIIDYGDWHSRGDTLQAVRAHVHVDCLASPGEADLTAHVDFEALALTAPRLVHSQMTPQGVFLERLGITARAQVLAKGLTGDALTAHVAAHRRLTHPEEMGTLFKILGLVPEGAAMVPGLER
ncbi:class I SAM-dependent methyltransferase [Maritimibacter sp. DP1N21-5]|uniref:class I SAM-dependent methyltransferase n=1 Tax=Maritimibacter sp. DP1N21-5 TaxID=2836867 RepID=UPI001C47DA25|nr:SAM-dependent methyltransferase [Maritimibacter sp. DP1N21-5]MBV7409178.1 SAM-dependent methyltransferase [Maritimibacter sp. DP1N21-5]